MNNNCQIDWGNLKARFNRASDRETIKKSDKTRDCLKQDVIRSKNNIVSFAILFALISQH